MLKVAEDAKSKAKAVVIPEREAKRAAKESARREAILQQNLKIAEAKRKQDFSQQYQQKTEKELALEILNTIG